MGLLSVVVRKKQNIQQRELKAAAADLGLEVRPLNPDVDYVDVWLEALQITSFRRLLTRYYPALASQVTQLRVPTGFSETTQVVSAAEFAGKKDAGKVLLGPKHLSGPLPYRGSRIGIDIGVLRLQSSDLTERYVALVADLATATGITVAGAAAGVGKVLADGMRTLVEDFTAGGLEIGCSRELARPRTGVFAVIGASTKKTGRSKVSFDGEKLLLANKPMTGVPYLVYSVRAVGHHHEYFKLPEISRPYRRLQEALAPGGSRKYVESFREDFEEALRTSPNLTDRDKAGLLAQHQANYADFTSKGRLLSAAGSSYPAIDELMPDWTAAKSMPLAGN